MAYPQGINFRATSGYVSDAAGDTYEIGTTANYPRTTAQGNTVGWEDAPTGTRDRVVQNAKIAGIHYLTSSAGVTARFRFDLPAVGDHDIRLAAGDASGGSFAKIELFDNVTSLGVLVNRIGTVIPANSFVDATGAEYTDANWPTSNTAVTKTFASTICRFKLGSGGGGNEVITHLRVSATGAADTTAPVLSSPTGTKTGSTTANGTVVTDEAGGTLYRLASTNASESVGTIKAAGLTTAVTATGSQAVSFASLTPNTVYYNHYVQDDGATIPNTSNAAHSTSYTTDPVDTLKPTLSSPTGASTGSTTASGTVTTDEANGTLYSLATTNVSESGATVKTSGTTQTITSTGVKNVTASSLAPSTTHYLHYVHRDLAGNDSDPVSSGGFTTAAPGDTLAPNISSPTAVATGATTASGAVVTNEANGFMYRYVSTNASESGSTIKTANIKTAVTATGSQAVSFTGLPPSTLLYAHYLHRDLAGNDSNVVTSAPFTTPAPLFTFAIPGKNIMGGVGTERKSVACKVSIINKTTDALVATKTGLTTDATTGLLSFTLAGTTVGTEYLAKFTADANNKDIGFTWVTPT